MGLLHALTSRLQSSSLIVRPMTTSRDTDAREIHSPAAPALRIAYLCAQYPAVSHTFVLREVEALRALGAEISTFSIRRSSADQLLAQADRMAFASTYAILPPHWRKLLAAHMKLIAKAPKVYLSTLAMALGLAPPGLRGSLWQVFYFFESVVLWSECRRRRIRHIHAHMANVAADVALLSAHIGSMLEPELPWSWSFTQHGPSEFFDVSHFRLAEKVRRALFVVCISDYARSQVMGLSQPETWKRLHVVHVGIPIAQFTRNSHLSPPPEEHPTILFVGRQVPVKGEAVLLEATLLLAERGHEFKVILAGCGPLQPTLESLAERLGVSHLVSFPGSVGQDDIHAFYECASIFCLPSFAEGVPCVLMEAMAMQIPVVSTRIAGIPELVDDGRTGLLVTPGRADVLADALARLLSDQSLCRELGSRARDKVKSDFNVEISAKQLYGLFAQKLLPAHQNARRGTDG
jgi:glycosyltransferase involved in cell wall biosynthesis